MKKQFPPEPTSTYPRVVGGLACVIVCLIGVLTSQFSALAFFDTFLRPSFAVLCFFALPAFILRSKYYIKHVREDYTHFYEYIGNNSWVPPAVAYLLSLVEFFVGWILAMPFVLAYAFFIE